MSENNSKIEDIKRRLYDPNDTVTHRTHESIIHPVNHNVVSEWEHKNEINNNMMNMKKPKSSIFKKFFIFSIIFFIGAIGYAFYIFSSGTTSVSNDNIDIAVIGNTFTKGGEELPLQIEVTNRNKTNIELANLVIAYPSGANDDISNYVRLPRIAIGTIKSGETITKNIKVTLFGDEKSNRNVSIKLEYHPENSNAIFTKSKDYPVNINSAPISVSIDAPDNITSGQEVTLKINTILNTSLPDGDKVIQVKYPNNFIFDSATPSPSFGNSTWSLDSLSLANPIQIEIKGRVLGQDKDQQVFHVYAGITKPTDKSTVDIVYNSLLHSINIVKPFIDANIIAEDVISSGDNVSVRIDWANNLSTKILDAQIIAKIGGNAYSNLLMGSYEGFFDSANSQIIWDKNSVEELGDIDPGQKGQVNFILKSKSTVGYQNFIKDPKISIDVSIIGKQPSLGNTYSEINNFSNKVIKILSDFQIVSSASYKNGEFPPKAEKETRYDVTWTLSNGTNSISGAVARSVIPVYVKWIGQNGQGENISYNESTREVIWNIGNVKPNTGSSSNREVTFTLALNPSTSQIGSTPQLMKEVYLSGQDTYTNTQVKSKYRFINTLLYGDPNFKSGFEKIAE